MTGLEEHMRAGLGIPVVESVAAAVKLAEVLVRLGLGTGKVGAHQPVMPRQSEGLPKALRQVYNRRVR